MDDSPLHFVNYFNILICKMQIVHIWTSQFHCHSKNPITSCFIKFWKVEWSFIQDDPGELVPLLCSYYTTSLINVLDFPQSTTSALLSCPA